MAWTCAVCTFENNALAAKCSMCDALNPESADGSWNCALCTFINQSSDSKCGICEQPKPNQEAGIETRSMKRKQVQEEQKQKPKQPPKPNKKEKQSKKRTRKELESCDDRDDDDDDGDSGSRDNEIKAVQRHPKRRRLNRTAATSNNTTTSTTTTASTTTTNTKTNTKSNSNSADTDTDSKRPRRSCTLRGRSRSTSTATKHSNSNDTMDTNTEQDEDDSDEDEDDENVPSSEDGDDDGNGRDSEFHMSGDNESSPDDNNDDDFDLGSLSVSRTRNRGGQPRRRRQVKKPTSKTSHPDSDVEDVADDPYPVHLFPPKTRVEEVKYDADHSWARGRDILYRVGEKWKNLQHGHGVCFTNPVAAKLMSISTSGLDAAIPGMRSRSAASLCFDPDFWKCKWHRAIFGDDGAVIRGSRQEYIPKDKLGDHGVVVVAAADDNTGADPDAPFIVLDFGDETFVRLDDYVLTLPLHTDAAYRHLELNTWTVEGSNDRRNWTLIQREKRDASHIQYTGGDFEMHQRMSNAVNTSARMTLKSHIVKHSGGTYFSKIRITVTSVLDHGSLQEERAGDAGCVFPLQRIRLYGAVRRTVYKARRDNAVTKRLFTAVPNGKILGDPQCILDVLNSDEGVQHLEQREFDEPIKGLQCRLKPYQSKCTSWMLGVEENGNAYGIHGGLLAHEMGLGKTVQIIALLLLQRQRRGKERTIILTPLSLVDQWMSEINKFAGANAFTVINFYGQQRKKMTTQHFEECDLIFSSYDTFTNCLGQMGYAYDDYDGERYYACEKPELIFTLSPHWFTRLVVDESHELKSMTSSRASRITMFADTKEIKHRWCLTGTPVADDFAVNLSATCFLLGMSREEYEAALSLSDAERKHSEIAQPFRTQYSRKTGRDKKFTRWGNADDPFYMQQKVKPFLSALMLRRTKKQVLSDDNFPEKREEIVYIELNEEEAVVYNKLAQEVLGRYRGFKEHDNGRGSGVMCHYMYLVQMLDKLRKLCDHPSLVYNGSRHQFQNGGDAADKENDGGGQLWSAFNDGVDALSRLKVDIVRRINEMESVLSAECPVCMEAAGVDGAILSVCGHLFCLECLKLMIAESEECGLCRAKCKNKDIIDIRLVFDSAKLSERHKEEYREFQELNGNEDDASDDDDDGAGEDDEAQNKSKRDDEAAYQQYMVKYTDPACATSKVDALLQRIQYIKEHHRGDKMVVFSNFGGVFSIISQRLTAEGMSHLQFNSSLSRAQRKKVLEKFTSTSSHEILLLSTKCASVGLNLMCANHVIFIDPRVNPSLDAQAIGRCWRLGQNKTVYVTRIITRNTVEEGMLSLLRDKENTEDGKGMVNLKQKVKMKEADFDMIFNYLEGQ